MSAISAVILAAAVSPLSVVIIEPPPSLGPEVGARIVESCNRALGKGRCELAPEPAPQPEPAPEPSLEPGTVADGAAPSGSATPAAPTTEPTTNVSVAPFRARLRWDGATLKVELSPSSSEELLAESTVHFSASDDEKQRWVAAGLLVASLTAAQSPEGEPAPEPPRPPPPRPRPTRVVAPPPPPVEVENGWGTNLRVDVGAWVAPGLDAGPLRRGLLLRASLLPAGLAFGPTLSLRAAHAPADEHGAELDSSSGSIGVFAYLTPPSARLSLEASAEVVGERALVRVTRGDESEELDAWRFGGRIGLTASVKLADIAGIWVGGDVTGLRPELDVHIDSKSVGAESWLRWAALAGLRFAVPGS